MEMSWLAPTQGNSSSLCFHSLGDAPLGPSSYKGLFLTFLAKKVWSHLPGLSTVRRSAIGIFVTMSSKIKF